MQTNTEKRVTSISDFGIDEERLERVFARIGRDVAAGVYPGAALAMARGGQIVAERVFGCARLGDDNGPEVKATKDTLWLLYSQTKPITSCAVWLLAEQGLLNFHHPISYYIPEFARLGKQDLTTFHCLTHQSGFPSANVSEDVWQDHGLLREAVSNFVLESAPGEKVFYHGYAAHWVQAALIEAITGQDFRKFIECEVIAPLNLKNLFVGVPEEEHGRLAGAYVCEGGGGSGGSSVFSSASSGRGAYAGAGKGAVVGRSVGADKSADSEKSGSSEKSGNSEKSAGSGKSEDEYAGKSTATDLHTISREFDNPAFYLSGVPGAGGYATAGDVAMFYQMLLGLGELNGRRILSPRMVQYATTNHTGDRPDEFFGIPMHRALGVHVRGNTATIRGLSSIAHPASFGHGGVGTSYSFADPQSGVSCTYITNSRLSEPWHSKRLDEIMTMAHASIIRI